MQFEYKRLICQHPLEAAELEHIGDEEWELVSVVSHNGFLHYHFMKPKTIEILQKFYAPEEKREQDALQEPIITSAGTVGPLVHDDVHLHEN